MVLRTIGQHFHPVGQLSVANMVNDPNCSIADGSGNLYFYTATNCSFKVDSTKAKFGTTSGKFTVSSTSVYPTLMQSFSVEQQKSYTASMWVNISTTLSTGIFILGRQYASDNTPMNVLGGQVLNGATTSGWIRTSILLPTDPGAARMDVVFIYPSSQPTALDSFNVDGIQLEPNFLASPFADGDMSGFCWAGTPGQSYTLKTEFPSALHAFQVGALRGHDSGMRAHATLTKPNIITFQS